MDSHTTVGILDLLDELRAQHPMTVILATHDAQVAARCERLIRLRDGAVVDDMVRSVGVANVSKTLAGGATVFALDNEAP